ncbi:MAG: hypothetical protein JWQ38_2930 [Flavipsychrobacter sp.]|nr:hypothetical protein [Flavipsychrobacter sp.]
MGVICALPAFLFFICVVYYLFLLLPIARSPHPIYSIEGITSHHYDTLFIMLAVYACAGAAVLIYCMVHLLKIKTLNTQTKMLWVLVLVTFMPLSPVLFWIFQVKKEPRKMPVYTDIA